MQDSGFLISKSNTYIRLASLGGQLYLSYRDVDHFAFRGKTGNSVSSAVRRLNAEEYGFAKFERNHLASVWPGTPSPCWLIKAHRLRDGIAIFRDSGLMSDQAFHEAALRMQEFADFIKDAPKIIPFDRDYRLMREEAARFAAAAARVEVEPQMEAGPDPQDAVFALAIKTQAKADRLYGAAKAKYAEASEMIESLPRGSRSIVMDHAKRLNYELCHGA